MRSVAIILIGSHGQPDFATTRDISTADDLPRIYKFFGNGRLYVLERDVAEDTRQLTGRKDIFKYHEQPVEEIGNA